MSTKLEDTTTCVINVMFALWQPHAVLCLRGCMHGRAYTLGTTSTPCAYLHTQSCLVFFGLNTSSLLFEIHRLSCLFTATCVSHQGWLFFSLSASLRPRGRDLRVSCAWCYSLKGGKWDMWAEVISKVWAGPNVDSRVWPCIFYSLYVCVSMCESCNS